MEGLIPCDSVTVAQLYRHGDRSPIIEYPTDKVPISWWYEGLGQLSIVGVIRHMHDMSLWRLCILCVV